MLMDVLTVMVVKKVLCHSNFQHYRAPVISKINREFFTRDQGIDGTEQGINRAISGGQLRNIRLVFAASSVRDLKQWALRHDRRIVEVDPGSSPRTRVRWLMILKRGTLGTPSA